MSSDLYKSFYAIIKKIPRGKVATYGQIAALAGHPRHARHVGFALSALPSGSKVPWHRVVNSQGQISKRGLDGNDEWQRILLEEEGVAFNVAGRISLRECQWK